MSQSEYRIRLREPHINQAKLKREAARFNVACMGRRFGKTALGLDVLIDPILLEGYPVAWVAPKYKLAQEVYREAKTSLKPLTKSANGTDMRIELVTGGVLEFWTLEDPDVGRGRKYKRMIIDEAAMARHLEKAWQESLQPTLMDFRGDAWFMSTPKGLTGPGAFFKKLFDRGQVGHEKYRKGWKSWQMPTDANPYIHPDEIASMRADLPELIARQEIDAEFVSFEGTVVRSEWLHTGTPPPLSSMRVYMAVDLAISLKEDADYTAIAVVGVEESGRVWVLHVERARVSFYDSIKLIEKVALRFNPLEVGVEVVQYQAAAVEQLLRTTTLPVRALRPDRDKLTRFQPVQVRYQNGLIWHAEGLPTEWEEELLSFPLAEHDDMVDAVGYAYAMCGEFGRNQLLFGDQAPKEINAVTIDKELPGLPSSVAQTLAEIKIVTIDAGADVCGRCEAFDGGMCRERGFIVGDSDPGCADFIEAEVVQEPIGIDDVLR